MSFLRVFGRLYMSHRKIRCWIPSRFLLLKVLSLKLASPVYVYSKPTQSAFHALWGVRKGQEEGKWTEPTIQLADIRWLLYFYDALSKWYTLSFMCFWGRRKDKKTEWYVFEAKGRLLCRMRASIIWSVYKPDTINIILPTTLLDVCNYKSFSNDGAELNEIR